MLGRHAARGEQNLEDDENLKRVVRFTIGAVRAVASTLARLPWGCRDQKDKTTEPYHPNGVEQTIRLIGKEILHIRRGRRMAIARLS
jgi:hypothetical protein